MRDSNSLTTTALQITSAIEWWQAAGVEYQFNDETTIWSSSAQNNDESIDSEQYNRDITVVPKTKDNIAVKYQKNNMPENLADFQKWWLTDPSLDSVGPQGRIPPRGFINARLMIVVVDPEITDKNKLLSGDLGLMVSRMLKAMQISETEVYIASVLPRHTPMAETSQMIAGGFDKILLHHLSLVSPKRVIFFGRNIASLIDGKTNTNLPANAEIKSENLHVPALITNSLDSMITMPKLKAKFWHRWLEWSGQKE